MSNYRSFWTWLLYPDRDGDRGISNIVNTWLLFHIAIGGVLSVLIRIPIPDLATKVAIPGSAILVGLSFAWAGRSASLFQDKAFSEFIINDGAPVEGYLYSFQLGILSVLTFLGITFLVYAGGLGLSTGSGELDNLLNRFFIVAFGSIALRECWGAIGFVNKFTIQFYTIRTIELQNQKDN